MTVEFLIAGDSDNPTRALNTHGQTGTRSERGALLSDGEVQPGVSPQAARATAQAAERPAIRKMYSMTRRHRDSQIDERDQFDSAVMDQPEEQEPSDEEFEDGDDSQDDEGGIEAFA